MPSRESLIQNLAKARTVGRPPRPWCVVDESRLIHRCVIPVVLVQPEMERGRFPLVSIPPFGRGFSRHL